MDDDLGILFILGPLVGGLVLYTFISAAVKTPGKILQRKFQSLGTLRGRTLESIAEVAGQPTSRSFLADGRALYQWMATGYHIALIFNGDICEGVNHEFASR